MEKKQKNNLLITILLLIIGIFTSTQLIDIPRIPTESQFFTDIQGINYSTDGYKLWIGDRSMDFMVRYNGKDEYLSENKNKLDKDKQLSKEYKIDDKGKIKILHNFKYKQNKKTSDYEFFYVFDVFDGEEIEVNYTHCIVGGKCQYTTWIDTNNSVNFADEYDYYFQDLYDNGFYLSSWEIVNTKLYLGFKLDRMLSKWDVVSLDPTISTGVVGWIDTFVIRKDLIGVFFVDTTADDTSFIIYNTSGAVYTGITDLTTNNYGMISAHQGCQAEDEDEFICMWGYGGTGGSSAEWSRYNIDGIDISGGGIIESSTVYPGNVCILNKTYAIVGSIDTSGGTSSYDIDLRAVSGTSITHTESVDTDVDDSRELDVSCKNSTVFVMSYWDDGSSDVVTSKVYDFDYTQSSADGIIQRCTVSTEGGVDATNVQAGDKYWYVYYYDTDIDKYDINVYDYDTCTLQNNYNSFADVDYRGGIAISNESKLMVVSTEDIGNDGIFRGYTDNKDGTLTADISETVGASSPTSAYPISIDSYQPSTGISLCNGMFVWSGIKTTSSIYINFTNSTGGAWDGSCEPAEIPSIDLNWTVWNGTHWENSDSYFSKFFVSTRAKPSTTGNEPEDQIAGSNQCIFKVHNNGTASATAVNVWINDTMTDITVKVDDDYTSTGATTLTTSPQDIHGSLASDANTEVCVWVDYGASPVPKYISYNISLT